MRKKIFKLTFAVALGLGLWGPYPAPSRSETAKTLWSQWAQLAQVRSIEIHEDWMGLSEVGPVGRQYLLRPEGDHFAGKAIFSLGGGAGTKTKEEPIAVPNASVQEFLRLLSQAKLEKGEYKPFIEHTDDYPSVSIDIQLGAGKLSFYSKSQGEWAIPWGVTLGGEPYITRSKEPAMAMSVMQPYFKADSMAKFTDEYRSQLRRDR
jgi:hypothetical protein